MQYVKVLVGYKIKLFLAETNPEKVMDIFLDELNNAKDFYEKEYILSLMEAHRIKRLTHIFKNQTPIDYDEDLNGNLFKK